MKRSLTFVVLASLLAVACGSDEPSADTTPLPTPVSTATGTTAPGTTAPSEKPSAGPDGSWVATAASLDGEPIELIDGWDVTITIEGDEVGGTAACNGYGGTATIGDDGSFTAGEFSITEMGCQPDVQALEQSFVAALGSFSEYAVDGDILVLTGGGHEWTFERLAPIDDAAIVGTTWVLDTYITDDMAANSVGMENATLTLHDQGSLSGSTGCRPFSGEWVDSGAEIVFASFAVEGECPPELQELDGWVVTVLGDGFRPTVEGNRLTVMSAGGEGLSYFTGE